MGRRTTLNLSTCMYTAVQGVQWPGERDRGVAAGTGARGGGAPVLAPRPVEPGDTKFGGKIVDEMPGYVSPRLPPPRQAAPRHSEVCMRERERERKRERDREREKERERERERKRERQTDTHTHTHNIYLYIQLYTADGAAFF